MSEAVRTAVRAAVASTSTAIILIVALHSVLVPDVAALGAYFPIICTATTASQTFINVRDNLVGSAIGVAVGYLHHFAVPSSLIWVQAAIIWLPLLIIALIHGFPLVGQRSALFGAWIAFMTTLMPGPLYSFLLVQSVALTITWLLSLLPRILGGARSARDVFADKAVEALKSLSAYYDMLQNRKIVSGPTISYLEDACYSNMAALHQCALLVARESWSSWDEEWDSLVMLMDSALLRLSCIHQTLGGPGWEGYSVACIEEIWQPALPSYEVLKVRTMCAMDDACATVRVAPNRAPSEGQALSIARVASLTRSDASLPHDGPVSVDHGNGVGVTGLSNDKSGQDIPMKSFGTLAAISEESTSSSYSSPPGPIDLDGEQGEQLVDKATAHAHADALALKEHPAVTVGLVNARSAANLRALAAAECQRNTPLLSSSSRQPRCSSGDLESRTIMDVSFDLISVQCKCRNCDETASINLVDNITATARKRLQEGRGGTDTSEELSRVGTFAGASVDFFAHILAVKRKLQRLGLRKPVRNVVLDVPRSLAGAVSGVADAVKKQGILGPLRSWEYKNWRYWTQVIVLVTAEYLFYTLYVAEAHAIDVRWFWAIISTIIVVRPTAVMSVMYGIQRALGTLVMFGLAYLTVLASKEDSTLSWAFANTLMVLLAKLAEQSLGPSWAAVPAVSVVTWQLLVLPSQTPGRQLTFEYAVSRFIGVSIGVLLGIVGSLVIFPQHAMPALFTNSKKLLTVALDSFVTLLSAESLEGRVDNVVLERHRKELTCSMRGVPALLAMTRDENRLWLLRSRALRNLDWPLLVKHLWALRRALAGCVSATRSGAFNDQLMREQVLKPLQPYFDDVVRAAVILCSATVDELEFYLTHGGVRRSRGREEDGVQAAPDRGAELMESWSKLERFSWPQYQLLRRRLAEGRLSVWHTMAFSRLVFSVRDYCENLKRISELIHGASKKD